MHLLVKAVLADTTSHITYKYGHSGAADAGDGGFEGDGLEVRVGVEVIGSVEVEGLFCC